uniref:F-box domain-containing protein n=1 Tax=Moniliophthora roreri TaxID=221103 RepID=A0A0W0F2C4_MONRR
MYALPDPVILCRKCKNTFVPNVSHPPVPRTALLTNEYPSHTEITQMNEFLADEERELRRYEAELERLRFIVQGLEMERLAIQRRIEERRSWCAAVRRLPRELLEHIFQYACLSADYSLSISDEGNIVDAPPFMLYRVSSFWRAVVAHRPRLWASISVDVCHLDRDVCSLIRLYLRHSAKGTLKLRIVDSKGYSRHRDGLTLSEYLGTGGESALSLLFGLFSRCQELDLCFANDHILSVLHPYNPPIAFPSLSVLHSKITYPSVQWFWDAVCNANRLTRIRTHLSEYSRIPYGQLTYLDIHSTDINLLLRVLRECHSLGTLVVNEVCRLPLALPLVVDPPAVFRNLRSLSLTTHESPDVLAEVFASITLPSLSSVTLEYLKEWSVDVDMSTFIAMLRRSSCSDSFQAMNLRSIRGYISPSDVQLILQLSTNLTSLEVCSKGDDHPMELMENIMPQLLSDLTVHDGSILAPRLTRLAIGNKFNAAHMIDDVAELLVKTAESRSRSRLVATGRTDVFPLEGLWLSFADRPFWFSDTEMKVSPVDLEPSIHARLGDLAEDGMKCIIEW